MVTIRVPATSANVGAGFDCMGLALSMYGTFTFREIEKKIVIRGCDPFYCNEQNLVYQSFQKVLEQLDKKISGVEIGVDCTIPLQRGLGSSAVCIVAGVCGANTLLGNPLSKQEVFALCTKIEGHPDNVAPALFGGLTISFAEHGQPIAVKYDVNHRLCFLAIVPSQTISTKKARSILPKQLSYEDAVFNIGHCCAFLKAMETGNSRLLKQACHDRLHEPYRKQWIPHYEEIQNLCEQCGALSLVISGSGSTLLAIADQCSVLETIQTKLRAKAFAITCYPLHVEPNGVCITN